MRVPLADAHSHVNPAKGLAPARLAELFKGSGGWFVALVSLSPWDYGIDPSPPLDAYERALEIHVRACSEVRSAGLRASCIAGFHPQDVDELASRGMRSDEVYELGLEVLKLEERLCREGKLDGIGEVGRQHRRTSADRALAAELIMEESARLAKDLDCVLHLHLEDVGPETVILTRAALARVGVAPTPRIVFHHSRPNMVPAARDYGFAATVYGLPSAVAEALKLAGAAFMVESDFPGVEMARALTPWGLANSMAELLNMGADEEDLYRLNVDMVVRTYRVPAP
mgnify:FL=1